MKLKFLLPLFFAAFSFVANAQIDKIKNINENIKIDLKKYFIFDEWRINTCITEVLEYKENKTLINSTREEDEYIPLANSFIRQVCHCLSFNYSISKLHACQNEEENPRA
jgi:hypothetical protein